MVWGNRNKRTKVQQKDDIFTQQIYGGTGAPVHGHQYIVLLSSTFRQELDHLLWTRESVLRNPIRLLRIRKQPEIWKRIRILFRIHLFSLLCLKLSNAHLRISAFVLFFLLLSVCSESVFEYGFRKAILYRSITDPKHC